jgi:hypothetical protein
MSGLTRAALASLAVHILGCLVFWYYPLVSTAIGFRNIEFVDEAYDTAILIDFSKRFSYPPGYIGFQTPDKTLTLEEIERLEKKRRAREEAQRRARERRAARKSSADESDGTSSGQAAGGSALATNATAPATSAAAEAPPKETYPGGFGKINTAPIRDQVQRLYDAYKEGKLAFPRKLRVGVTGRINADGSLSECRILVASGIEEIDRAAMAILDAVSASRALGPLHEMTSLTMVLNVGEHAELSVVGFTNSEEAAANIVNLANAALLYARFRKVSDPGTMVILNNLKVSRTGQRVQAIVAMPRQKASESLAQTMGPKT